MRNVMWFKELNKSHLLEAGGKGANLGEMYDAGFPIPNGFVTTSEAYFKHLDANKIRGKIDEILKKTDVNDSDQLNSASERIKKLIMDGKMPEDIENDVKKAYKELNDMYGETSYVAVRSSATAEDLPSISEDDHAFVRINGKTHYLTMRELYELVGDGKHVVLEVPAMKDAILKWHRVEMLYRHKANSKLYKIKTKTGREITVSPNHSLIALDRCSLKPKISSITDLGDGDVIPTVYRLPETKNGPVHIDVLDYVKGDDVVVDNDGIRIKNKSSNWRIQHPLKRKLRLDEEFLYFLGLYVAEGSTYENNCIIVTNSSSEVQEKVKRFLKTVGIYKNQKINKGSIRVYCKALVRLLHALCGKPLQSKGKGRSCRIKRVPNFVFGLSKEQIAHFLQGCFDGDGYVGKGRALQYTSISEMLIGGMAKLLEILGFNLYLRRKKNAIEITIPDSEARKFKEMISFVNLNKARRLNGLIESYEKKLKHPDFIQGFEVDEGLAVMLRERIEKDLKKGTRIIRKCPLCKNKLGKSSGYKQRERYHCRNCNRMFYEDKTEKVSVQDYIFYDEKGRFKKDAVPWNKGLIRGKYSVAKLRKRFEEYGLDEELSGIFNGDVRWEKVKEVKEIPYNGWVYDFTVPDVENFVGGLGGVITHNTASFAGQQATFLNVHGEGNLLEAVKKCWASLFEARAIFYRTENKFEHMKVGLSAVVQRMVQSEKAGVVFTVDPLYQDPAILSVEGAYGLGEVVVGGLVTPDTYRIDKENFKILDKKVSSQTWMIVRVKGENQRVDIKEEMREKQKLSDLEIKDLAKISKKIEEHYNYPQDIEYAFEKGNLYIVQSRPITTLSEKAELKEVAEGEPAKEKPPEGEKVGKSIEKAKIICKGLGASPGMGMGSVKLIPSSKEIKRMERGDILVTAMTTPDFVPAMKKAAAIVTNSGGMTSHAAIVSRELGVPCIVGTSNATEILKEGMDISVDGGTGIVYEGLVSPPEAAKAAAKEGELVKAPSAPITATKIYVNLADVDQAEKVSKLPVDGIGLLRAEFMVADIGQHPRKMLEEGKRQEFVDKLAEGLRRFAAAFHPRPVVYRATDFKTNEYRNLEGGEKYEPHEENPMMGYRGAARYIKEPDIFKMELEALKKVREEYHLRNLWLMIPFVRRIGELRAVKQFLHEVGIYRTRDFKLWIMVEVPSTVFLIDRFCKEGIDGISVGTNDLTQLILGLDRDNATMAKAFDERNEAVLRALKRVITVCEENGVTSSLCGQAPSVYPEFAEKLVEFGITSMSVNPDAVLRTRRNVRSAEQKIMLKRLSKILRGAKGDDPEQMPESDE